MNSRGGGAISANERGSHTLKTMSLGYDEDAGKTMEGGVIPKVYDPQQAKVLAVELPAGPNFFVNASTVVNNNRSRGSSGNKYNKFNNSVGTGTIAPTPPTQPTSSTSAAASPRQTRSRNRRRSSPSSASSVSKRSKHRKTSQPAPKTASGAYCTVDGEGDEDREAVIAGISEGGGNMVESRSTSDTGIDTASHSRGTPDMRSHFAGDEHDDGSDGSDTEIVNKDEREDSEHNDQDNDDISANKYTNEPHIDTSQDKNHGEYFVSAFDRNEEQEQDDEEDEDIDEDEDGSQSESEDSDSYFHSYSTSSSDSDSDSQSDDSLYEVMHDMYNDDPIINDIKAFLHRNQNLPPSVLKTDIDLDHHIADICDQDDALAKR